MSDAPVILYGYESSPFVGKIRKLLLLKKIPHHRVELGMIPPRPELLALGVPYRRVPVLAIGNDVYCDSTLITDVLERRFPPSEGYPSFYPPRVGSEHGRGDTGLAKVLTTYWANNIFFGGQLDVKALDETQGSRASAIASHLGLLEEQLSDGRQYLLDTDRPGLLDIQLYLVISWVYSSTPSSDEPIEGFKGYVRELFDPVAHSKIIKWLERTKSYLQPFEAQEGALFSNLSGDEAARIVLSSSHESVETVVGFEEVEGRRLGVKVGDMVSVTPTDTAFIPSTGRLIALNWQEVVLEVDASGSAGTIRLHFPRLEFAITKA